MKFKENYDIEGKLKVGSKIKLGKKYCDGGGFKYGEIIELEMGVFEHENGLYCEDVECLAWYDEEHGEWESIYHLFGNQFEQWMDCEIVDV